MAAPSPELKAAVFETGGSKHSFQYSLLHCLSDLSKSQGQVVLDTELVDHTGDITSHGEHVFRAQN